ncbi:hypothetical protein [Pontibacillus marinus]|uniref:Uncharacterized protein n=1 Tax=Pontibacillus marinus BH030004 = DSM 16465 TaxID=1385511 RepID=A0A0A5G673_9BACI|nr:hypothetical protein [Pontibacillus marinus]KGX86678.1 hypothetical protein N783_11830 [Pontibacillus marinus BH030004 = DSM 16465]
MDAIGWFLLLLILFYCIFLDELGIVNLSRFFKVNPQKLKAHNVSVWKRILILHSGVSLNVLSFFLFYSIIHFCSPIFFNESISLSQINEFSSTYSLIDLVSNMNNSPATLLTVLLSVHLFGVILILALNLARTIISLVDSAFDFLQKKFGFFD